jgi:hypothetical protein
MIVYFYDEATVVVRDRGTVEDVEEVGREFLFSNRFEETLHR